MALNLTIYMLDTSIPSFMSKKVVKYWYLELFLEKKFNFA